MKKVRWHDDERVDAPDVRALGDLVEEYVALALRPVLGADVEANVYGGVLHGLAFSWNVAAVPKPSQACTLAAGAFVDRARHVPRRSVRLD